MWMLLNIETGIKIGTKRNSQGQEGSHLKLVWEAHFKLISLNEMNVHNYKHLLLQLPTLAGKEKMNLGIALCCVV